MRISKLLAFTAIALCTWLSSAKTMLATQIEVFNVTGYPAANPEIQGPFTVYGSNGLAGPYANGGLGAYGSPSTIKITANGFLFDATSIGVGGANSSIPAETETFIGDVYGGGTVSQTFNFPGNSQNFVTANLVGFNNLVDLRANIGFVTLQDLTYTESAAPEPGTFFSLGIALAAAALIYRRKRSRNASVV